MNAMLRPWKLLTLGIGLGLLIAGSHYYPALDWDMTISIIMARFTDLTAGWSMHTILEGCGKAWPFMVLATWWCVDGCYSLYWYWVKPEVLAYMRDANWPASLSLYCMCGLVWYFNGATKDALQPIE